MMGIETNDQMDCIASRRDCEATCNAARKWPWRPCRRPAHGSPSPGVSRCWQHGACGGAATPYPGLDAGAL